MCDADDCNPYQQNHQITAKTALIFLFSRPYCYFCSQQPHLNSKFHLEKKFAGPQDSVELSREVILLQHSLFGGLILLKKCFYQYNFKLTKFSKRNTIIRFVFIRTATLIKVISQTLQFKINRGDYCSHSKGNRLQQSFFKAPTSSYYSPFTSTPLSR